MKPKNLYFVLTIIVPIAVTATVMTLVFSGFGTPAYLGADGKIAKITDDDYCRVSAFVTDDRATAQERSEACSKAKELIYQTSPLGFVIMSIIGIFIMRSIVKPVEHWESKEKRSAI